MITKEKILDKLSKLRALATDNTNIEEAAVAMAKMQDMLFKYNLSIDEIKNDVDNTPAYEKEYYDLGVSTGLGKKWKSTLFFYIAENNFCKAFVTGSNQMVLIGQEDNRSVVKFLYEYLAKDLKRMCNMSFKVRMDFYCKPELWKKSFYFGAINTIYRRLKEQKSQSIVEANLQSDWKGTALALRIDNALTEAVRSLVGTTRQGRQRRSRVSNDGYSSGVKAGNDAKLNRELPQRRMALNS